MDYICRIGHFMRTLIHQIYSPHQIYSIFCFPEFIFLVGLVFILPDKNDTWCGAVQKSTNGVDIENLGRTDSAPHFSGLLKYNFLVNVHVK